MKYLISIATELDGHAGSVAIYYEQKDKMTEDSLRQIITATHQRPGDKVEVTFDRFDAESGEAYADISYDTVYEGTPLQWTDSVAIGFKPVDGKISLAESRTG